jgi:hypothetical protein
MARSFAEISVPDLERRVRAVMGDCGMAPLVGHLGRDVKVSFDLENQAFGPADFGPEGLMGLRRTDYGLTYWGLAAGGDWEHPVFFIAYWDGRRLRGYVPTRGNPWNTRTRKAYGNDDAADRIDAARRWPERRLLDPAVEFDAADLDFDPAAIAADIRGHLLPRDQAPAMKRGRADEAQRALSLYELRARRVGSLVYHGADDEGAELFDATCRLCYRMSGLGEDDRAEVLCAWAEDMARASVAHKGEARGVTRGVWEA